MKKKKTPWPTKAVMTQIYEKHLWGGTAYKFYSGDGSHNKSITEPYIEAVKMFLSNFKSPLSICDLGCGDFNIGKQLLPYSKEYHAVDIVEDLITFNKNKFTNKKVNFKCMDISKDTLPKADCVIIRQVLQHLSNEEVHKVLKKLTLYKYIIITEHIPSGDFVPNKDILSGQGIRLKVKSGLDILKTPFNFKVKSQKELVKIPLENNKGTIRTVLFTLL